MEIKDKIVLKEKQSIDCPVGKLVGTLQWKKAVDLDLWCFIKTKNGRSDSIGFSNLGSLQSYPNIQLDKDAGVGDKSGDNEENIRFETLEHIDHAFICANIYGKSNANFSKYDGAVIIKSKSTEFSVPLTSKAGGSWCIIAHLDTTGPTPQLRNINQTVDKRPTIDNLIAKIYSPKASDGTFPPRERPRGFIAKLFGG